MPQRIFTRALYFINIRPKSKKVLDIQDKIINNKPSLKDIAPFRIPLLFSSRTLLSFLAPYLLEEATIARNDYFNRFDFATGKMIPAEKQRKDGMNLRRLQSLLDNNKDENGADDGIALKPVVNIIALIPIEFELYLEFCDSIAFISHLYIPIMSSKVMQLLTSARLRPRLQSLCLAYSSPFGVFDSIKDECYSTLSSLIRYLASPVAINNNTNILNNSPKFGYSLRAIDFTSTRGLSDTLLLQLSNHLSPQNFEYISLDSCGEITDSGLSQFLSKNFGPSLKFLDLSATKFGPLTIQAIHKFCVSALQILKLDFGTADSTEWRTIDKCLGELFLSFHNPERRCQLRYLSLSGNRFISNATVSNLANRNDNNNADDDDSCWLRKYFTRCDLGSVQNRAAGDVLIIDTVAKVFHQKSNSSSSSTFALRHLNIGSVDCSSVSAFASCFESITLACPNLMHLDLFFPHEKFSVTDEILDIIGKNLSDTIEELDVSGTFLSCAGLTRLVEKCGSKKLRSLEIINCDVDGKFITALVQQNKKAKLSAQNNGKTVLERLVMGHQPYLRPDDIRSLRETCKETLKVLSVFVKTDNDVD